MSLLELIGSLVVTGAVILSICLIIILFLLYLAIRYNKVIFPNLIIFLVTALNGPIKAVFNLFNLNTKSIDRIEIEVKNNLSKPRFAKVPKNQRFLFLPQCLRDSQHCPAPLTDEGFQCKSCGKCVIGNVLKPEAEKLGYKVFIAPGGKLVKRIMRKYRPKAVVGVACLSEIKDGHELCSKYKIPAKAVPLLKDGCIDTIADTDEILHALEL